MLTCLPYHLNRTRSIDKKIYADAQLSQALNNVIEDILEQRPLLQFLRVILFLIIPESSGN